MQKFYGFDSTIGVGRNFGFNAGEVIPTLEKPLITSINEDIDMAGGVRLEFAQFGDFDSFDILRSSEPMDVNALPSPIATGLLTMYYVDTSVIEDEDYYYRVRVWRDSESELSDEIKTISLDLGIYKIKSPFSTDLTDRTGKTWTAYGNAKVSGGALQLDGNGDYLSMAYSPDFHFLNNEDVTIRFKANVSNFSSDRRVLLSTRKDSVSNIGFWIIYAGLGSISFFYWRSVSEGLSVNYSWAYSYAFGTDFELSLERFGMGWRLYINGNQVGIVVPQTVSDNTQTNSELIVGSEINAGGGNSRDLKGSMSDLQILKGIALGGGGETTPIID